MSAPTQPSQARVCLIALALGLDPNVLTSLNLEWEARSKPTAHWSGMRVLTDTEVQAVGEILAMDEAEVLALDAERKQAGL